MSEVRIGLGRPAAAAAAAVVLSLTASGCVTVHGELEVVPTTTKAQAARALSISYRALLYKIRDAGLPSNRSAKRSADGPPGIVAD